MALGHRHGHAQHTQDIADLVTGMAAQTRAEVALSTVARRNVGTPFSSSLACIGFGSAMIARMASFSKLSLVNWTDSYRVLADEPNVASPVRFAFAHFTNAVAGNGIASVTAVWSLTTWIIARFGFLSPLKI